MTITNKDSILKKYYELNGQQSMFGYDNLDFKTINHPTPHRFKDLCPDFKLKIINPVPNKHPVIELSELLPLAQCCARSEKLYYSLISASL